MKTNFLKHHLSNFWMGFSGGLVQSMFIGLTLVMGITTQILYIFCYCIRCLDLIIRGLLFSIILILLGMVVEFIWLIRKLNLVYLHKTPHSLAKRQIAKEVILFTREVTEKI